MVWFYFSCGSRMLQNLMTNLKDLTLFKIKETIGTSEDTALLFIFIQKGIIRDSKCECGNPCTQNLKEDSKIGIFCSNRIYVV